MQTRGAGRRRTLIGGLLVFLGCHETRTEFAEAAKAK